MFNIQVINVDYRFFTIRCESEEYLLDILENLTHWQSIKIVIVAKLKT